MGHLSSVVGGKKSCCMKSKFQSLFNAHKLYKLQVNYLYEERRTFLLRWKRNVQVLAGVLGIKLCTDILWI